MNQTARTRKEEQDANEVVKCACGLPMRQKDWAAHWQSCYKGSSVPVTEQDVNDLEAHEQRCKEWTDKCDAAQRQWLAGRQGEQS